MATRAATRGDDSAPTLRASLWPLLVLALAIAAGFTMMGSFSMVQESAKAELRLSDSTLALIQGLSAALPMLLFSVPVGILVDRANRLRLLIVMAGVWTAGTALTAFAAGAPLLFAARMLTGIGAAGALTAAISLSADLCLPQQRGRAMLIATIGKSFGQAAAFALSGWLLGLFAAVRLDGFTDWRATHLALALISLVACAPLLLLREPARREVEAGPGAPFRVVMAELWSRRRFLIPLFVGQVGVVMADAAAGIWAAPVVQRTYGLQPDQFAGWLGGIVLVTGIAGSVLGGLLADWGQKTGRRGGLLIGAVAAAVVGVPTALFPVMPTPTGFATLLGLLILAGTITGLITSVALTVLLPNELRGLSVGAFITVAGLIGFGVAPSLVTLVSSLLGGEQYLGDALAIVGTVVSLVAVLGFLQAMRVAPASVHASPA